VTPTLASALAAMAPGYSAEQHRKVAKAMTKDMQAKHTEGPWTTDLVISSQAGRVAIEPDIAIVYVQPSRYDGSESKRRLANARLIASAPDLLAALEALVDDADTCEVLASNLNYHADKDCKPLNERFLNNVRATIKTARAAIAKARNQ
jgi:hypothetical protein